MTTINGLPAHVLLVHLVVVLLPLTAAFAVLGSMWPAAQRKLTFLTPVGALGGLIIVLLTTSAGQFFAAQLPVNPRIEYHISLGQQVIYWAAALFVVTAAQWAYFQFARPKRWITVVLAVLTVGVAVGTTIQVVLTGDSGAQAVWQGVIR